MELWSGTGKQLDPQIINYLKAKNIMYTETNSLMLEGS